MERNFTTTRRPRDGVRYNWLQLREAFNAGLKAHGVLTHSRMAIVNPKSWDIAVDGQFEKWMEETEDGQCA